jgi:NTP pyrophosphatase (non-canonical NTP hydrolase)
MELNEFKEKFNSISLTNEKLQDYIDYVAENVNENYTISQHVIICIEECSELQQTLTKLIRGKTEDKMHILEEMADVILAIKYLQNKLNISDEELNKAICVKAKRNYNRCH